MAKKKSKVVEPEEDSPKAKETEAKKQLLKEALRNYKLDAQADKDNRDGYLEDMKFTLKPGEQWDITTKNDRGKDRPMYEFNELRIKCKNAINHIRANRPQAKIRASEEGDKDLAEVRQGLFQNDWNNSDGDSVTDYAATHQVVGGYGAWRIDTEYDDESVSEQNIKIRTFINPLCLLADRAARDEMKRDARHWFVFSKMPNEAFEEKYPKAERDSFDLEEALEQELDDEQSTWVAEYWKKVPITLHLCLLSDGKTIDKNDPMNAEIPEGVTVVKERQVKSHKIVQYIISGSSVLEGPNDWAGKYFPFVPVYGEYMVVDGKIVWYGLPRFSKDAQRAHNWAMTSVIETIASAPLAKDWATPAQAAGHTEKWAEAHKKNFPFKLYNPDPEAPGPPVHIGSADVPVALIQAAQMSAAALNNTTGITLSNEGRVSNETSGRAIRARQDEGMIATYNFNDNMAKAHKRTAEIVIDLQGKIYDTQRNLRVLGHDGAEKYIKINQPDPVTGKILNDMSVGKFDIVVTTGPSYATQRQEAAEFYTQFSQANPAVGMAAADLIVKAQDYPMSDAIAERLKLMLPPQIQASINKDKPLPPEAQAAMMQAEQAMQMVQQQGAMVQQASQEVQGEKAAADKAKSDVQIQIANLKVQEANLAKDVADFKTLVAQTELKLAEKQQVQGDNNEREQLSGQLEQALGRIQQESAAMMAQFAQVMSQMQANVQPQVVVAPSPPRPRIRALSRVNGKLIPEYEDEQQGVQ